MGGTRVVEGRQRTEQFEIRVGDLLHVDNRAQELPDAAVRSASRPSNTAHAAAAPNGPQAPVKCQPRKRAAEGSSARLERIITS